MKIQRFLIAALFVTALASTATAARFYAQPSIALAVLPDFKPRLGPSLAAGIVFAGKHALEIEGGHFETVSRHDSNKKLRVIPVTVNYRYEFPIAERLSGSLGVAVGLTNQEANYTFVSYDYPYAGAPYVYKHIVTDYARTAGCQGVLSFRLSDHYAIILSVKALHVEDTRSVSRGTFLIGQLGLNCRL